MKTKVCLSDIAENRLLPGLFSVTNLMVMVLSEKKMVVVLKIDTVCCCCITDVDECTVDPSVCGPGTCQNLLGGYQCICSAGYKATTGNLTTCEGTTLQTTLTFSPILF